MCILRPGRCLDLVAVTPFLCATIKPSQLCALNSDDSGRSYGESCKEGAVMRETERMAEEANRLGEEVQEQSQKMGREYQRAVESGFETASRSFSEANKGFQALTAE